MPRVAPEGHIQLRTVSQSFWLVWLKPPGVPMEPPEVREFERFTPREASLFFRYCQTP